MRLFQETPLLEETRPHRVTRHDSPLYELALETLAEHRPEDSDANPVRRCDACRRPWPCPRYQLALVAEIQVRSYESHKFPAPAIPGSPDRAATPLPDPA